MRLEGKKAVVTGARRSIGRAIALAFAREGADVLFTYRTGKEEAETVREEIIACGRRGLMEQVDLSEGDAPERLMAGAIAQLGAVDILVNNAGISGRSPFLEVSTEEFSRCHHLNTEVPLRLTQALAHHLIDRGAGGSVINISSISGVMAAHQRTAYACSKAALNMLTALAALELAPHGIRVNGIAPGITASGLNLERMENPEAWQERIAPIPLGRAGTPEDHAALALFLASDESSWLTGRTIPLDGGSTLAWTRPQR